MKTGHFFDIENDSSKSASKTNNHSSNTSGCRNIIGEDYDCLRETVCRMFGVESIIS
jgi:hypothetical protein